MERDVMSAQFEAGLRGLGLLRAWPFLDAGSAAARLSELQRVASDETHETLDVLDTATGYAAWSVTYEERVNPLLIAEQPCMGALVDDLRAGRALDAACGTGRLTRMLVDHGNDVTGVDPSDAMLSRARSSAPQATYHRASLLHLPFPDASFEIVCCGLALTHVPLLHPAIAEMARVLTQGGRLLISDVHPVAVATGAHAFFRHPDGSRGVVRNELHWHGEYLDAFATAGLRVRRCLEPRFSRKVLHAFTGKGSTTALSHLVGLPYVLVWECVRETGLT
jgi:SAM-dependent methyltransferase